MTVAPAPGARPSSDPGPAGPPRAARGVTALLAPLDRLFERVYGSRFNPLLQSGNLAVLCFLVTLASGLYLFLFYRIAEPHASVAHIQDEVFLGSWARSLHRYAADLAMAATVLHLLRKLAAGQTWGPRTLAWISGLALLGVVMFCGWTGLVLVWDAQGLQIADQGARLLDLLPIFSLPIRRAFDGVEPVPSSFFFMNLFLHVAAPLGLAAGLWLHVSQVARPVLLPPRRVRRATLALLALFAALWPVALAPAADLLALPGAMHLDLFYAFWLPAAKRLPPLALVGLWAAVLALAAAAPLYWRPRRPIRPSAVDEDLCTGCTTCYQDCPYEAIAMVPRARGRQSSELVARVDPERCVGCGICAGSCAPMGVGPAGRTGRDQLAEARSWLLAHPPSGREVVVIGCRNAIAGRAAELDVAAAELHLVGCAGSVHTSVVELLIRSGTGGVFLLSCPGRDCSFREGPKWLAERLFHGREAELRERVDRRRVALGAFSPGELAAARREIAALRGAVAALEARPESGVVVEPECAATDQLVEVADA